MRFSESTFVAATLLFLGVREVSESAMGFLSCTHTLTHMNALAASFSSSNRVSERAIPSPLSLLLSLLPFLHPFLTLSLSPSPARQAGRQAKAPSDNDDSACVQNNWIKASFCGCYSHHPAAVGKDRSEWLLLLLAAGKGGTPSSRSFHIRQGRKGKEKKIKSNLLCT